jgi:hypothetical protein
MKMISFFVFPYNRAPVEWNCQGKTELLVEKPVPVPLCPSQIPHGLTRDRTRASVVRGRRLTAWAMARPETSLQAAVFRHEASYVPTGVVSSKREVVMFIAMRILNIINRHVQMRLISSVAVFWDVTSCRGNRLVLSVCKDLPDYTALHQTRQFLIKTLKSLWDSCALFWKTGTSAVDNVLWCEVLLYISLTLTL